MATHKRGEVLRSDAREIVYNVIKYFDEEKRLQTYHTYEHAGARAAMATGLAVNTISRIRKEGKLAALTDSRIRTPSKGKRGQNNTRVPLDNYDLCEIRQIITSIYDVGKEAASVNKILAMAKRDLNYKGSKTTFRRILKEKLGFVFQKCHQNKRILIERDDIKAWRTGYLRRVRKNDALGKDKKIVVYIDETWIHAHLTSKIDKSFRKSSNSESRWVVVHAGTEKGFVNGAGLIFKAKPWKGDYRNAMESSDFIKYVKEILIPHLPPQSIVVMDNASYHNMIKDKAPTHMTRKEEIINWMRNQNIPFEEEWTKSELLQQLKRHRPDKKYVVDELLQEHGHEALRLPPFNTDLNPLENIWDLIKNRVKSKYVDEHENKLPKLALEALASITSEDWNQHVKYIKRIENKYWERDVVREKETDDFVLSMGMESDYSDDADDSYDDNVMSGVESDDPGEGSSGNL